MMFMAKSCKIPPCILAIAVVVTSTASASAAVAAAAAANLQELPAPGSSAALQLLSNPATPDDIRGWYAFHEDSQTITQQHTRSFLKQLEQQIGSSGSNRKQSSDRHLLTAISSSSSNSSSTPDFQPFLKVSKDVLNYLRSQHSTTILHLLRRYSQSDSSSSSSNLTLSDAEVEASKLEVDQALNPAALGKFYKTVSSKCKHYSHYTGAQAGRKLLKQSHQSRQQQQQQQYTRRHLHQARGSPKISPLPTASQIFSPNHPQGLEEMLCSISTLSPVGLRGMSLKGIPEDIAQGTQSDSDSELTSGSASTESQGVVVSKQISSERQASHQQMRQGSNRSSNGSFAGRAHTDPGDNWTDIEPGSDTGDVTSVTGSNNALPPVAGAGSATSTKLNSSGGENNATGNSTRGSSRVGSSGSVECPVQPEKATTPFQLVVPVNFHVLRYGGQHGYYMPPMWEDSTTSPLLSAQNLIKVANKYYQGTGIQFKVHEVRTDPKKFPYLLLSTKSAWIKCSVHSTDTQWPCNTCLQKVATKAELAPLFQSYAINIFVSGSSSEPLCKSSDKDYSSCADVARGCSNPVGPWANAEMLKDIGVSANWKAESTGVDWVWISYDDFNPDVYNDFDIAWDGGGATVAHEIGHYLGLLHTFDGEYTCDGDGYDYGDKVPDTAASESAQTFSIYSQKMYEDLSQWCSSFREGEQPDPRSLLQYNTCNSGGSVVGDYIDPIFNVMNYPPDVCCMTFTPGQVTRMQQMVTVYRSKMVAKYTV